MEQIINDWYLLHYIMNPYILVNFSWMYVILTVTKLITKAIRERGK